MGVSKVEIDGVAVIDLTSDTVNPHALLEGMTAHGRDGEPITGAVTTGQGYCATITNPSDELHEIVVGGGDLPIDYAGERYYYSDVYFEGVPLEELDVKLSTDPQTFTAYSAPGDPYGYSVVKVDPINLQSKSVTPTTSEQTITADDAYDGLAQVIVAAASGDGGSSNLIARGTFDAGSSGASSVVVMFDTLLDSAPTLIVFWEATTGYSTTARTKGGIGMSEALLTYGSSNLVYRQRRWAGTTSNAVIATNLSTSITGSASTGISDAKKAGFTAKQYSSSYLLYGTYNYIAVVAPSS